MTDANAAATLVIYAIFFAAPAVLVLTLVLDRYTRLGRRGLLAAAVVLGIVTVAPPAAVWAVEAQTTPRTCESGTECYDHLRTFISAAASLVGALVVAGIMCAALRRPAAAPKAR